MLRNIDESMFVDSYLAQVKSKNRFVGLLKANNFMGLCHFYRVHYEQTDKRSRELVSDKQPS